MRKYTNGLEQRTIVYKKARDIFRLMDRFHMGIVTCFGGKEFLSSFKNKIVCVLRQFRIPGYSTRGTTIKPNPQCAGRTHTFGDNNRSDIQRDGPR